MLPKGLCWKVTLTHKRCYPGLLFMEKIDLIDAARNTVAGYVAWLERELARREFASITLQGVPAQDY